MQRHTQRPAARAAVSVLAAAALLVSLMAAPASAADNPASTDVMGLLKGGYIALGETKPASPENSDHYFPLGEKGGESSVCDKGEPRSHVLANDLDSSGSSTDLEFNFAQGTTGIKGTIFFINYEVCATLKVLNANNLVMDTSGKDVSVYVPPETNNEGPVVEVQFAIKNQSNGNELAVCRTTAELGAMVGTWADGTAIEGKQTPEWDLTLDNGTKKIEVPEVLPEQTEKYDCSQSDANSINSDLGLPRQDGNIELMLATYDCNTKNCPGLL